MINAAPIFEYGTLAGTWAYDGEGYRRMIVQPAAGEPSLTVTSSLRLGMAGARCYARSSLNEGDSAFVAMSWRGSAPTSIEEAQAQCEDTVSYWRDWLSTGTFPDHPGTGLSSAAPLTSRA